MKVFKVTYTQGSNRSDSFLAATGQEMKQYFQVIYPGLPELQAESFAALKEELAQEDFVISASVEPFPMTSLDALALVIPNIKYSNLQLRSFVKRALTYDTVESKAEYQEVLAKINKWPIMGSEILDLIR